MGTITMSYTNTARVEARTSKEILTLLKRAAEIEGRSLSEYIISAAKAAAEKTISASNVIELSVQDQLLFADALISPPTPNEALQRAIANRKKLLSS